MTDDELQDTTPTLRCCPFPFFPLTMLTRRIRFNLSSFRQTSTHRLLMSERTHIEPVCRINSFRVTEQPENGLHTYKIIVWVTTSDNNQFCVL
eukprot:gene19193-932_t